MVTHLTQSFPGFWNRLMEGIKRWYQQQQLLPWEVYVCPSGHNDSISQEMDSNILETCCDMFMRLP